MEETKFGYFDITQCNSEKQEFAIGAELEIYDGARGVTNIRIYCERTSDSGTEGKIRESKGERYVMSICKKYFWLVCHVN